RDRLLDQEEQQVVSCPSRKRKRKRWRSVAYASGSEGCRMRASRFGRRMDGDALNGTPALAAACPAQLFPQRSRLRIPRRPAGLVRGAAAPDAARIFVAFAA